MDFGWTNDQKELYDEVARFAKTHLNDDVARRDANHESPSMDEGGAPQVRAPVPSASQRRPTRKTTDTS